MTLNYQHLYYFWTVVREQGISAAARSLRVSAPTISVQVRQLEAQYDTRLLIRKGRGIALTEVGQAVYRYADGIFSIGKELEHFLQGKAHKGPMRVEIGVAHVFPKLVTWKLLEPIRQLDESCHITCREATPSKLVEELALHQLDVILSDTPLQGQGVALYDHFLGESTVSFFAARRVAESVRSGFPRSLANVDLLLPTTGTEMRRSLEAWFSRVGLRPRIAAEFDDLALLKVAGEHGLGVFPVPDVVAEEAMRHYRIDRVGTPGDVVERFYAVSAERQIVHPAVSAIASQAPRFFQAQ